MDHGRYCFIDHSHIRAGFADFFAKIVSHVNNVHRQLIVLIWQIKIRREADVSDPIYGRKLLTDKISFVVNWESKLQRFVFDGKFLVGVKRKHCRCSVSCELKMKGFVYAWRDPIWKSRFLACVF